MAKYIIVKENDNSAGCLTGIIFLIIAVVALAIVAFNVLFIIGIILLIIAGIFAAIITIRNYILAVVESVKTHRSISKPSGWIFPTFIYSWAENISKIKNNFSEFVTLPFMSFKKWVDFGSAILLCVVGVLLNIIYIPIHLLIILILFVCFSVVNLVKKFIRH